MEAKGMRRCCTTNKFANSESGRSTLIVFLKYTKRDDDAILISTTNPYFPMFIYI